MSCNGYFFSYSNRVQTVYTTPFTLKNPSKQVLDLMSMALVRYAPSIQLIMGYLPVPLRYLIYSSISSCLHSIGT